MKRERNTLSFRIQTFFVSMIMFISLSSFSFAADLPGETLSLFWGVPFLGILLSIATGPLFYPHIWEEHYGKIVAGWVLTLIFPLMFYFGLNVATTITLHIIVSEYLPFIILLAALFTISGGIVITGNIHGTPWMNTYLLFIGCFLASFIGTTGASMVMIRPIIRANDNRHFNTHVIVFFIFLVSNISGSLTALGDPPLFVGFLKGVDFFWTTQHLLYQTLFVGGTVLGIFFMLDCFFFWRESFMPSMRDKTPDSRIGMRGWFNVFLLAIVILLIIISGYWDPQISLNIFGMKIGLQNILRDVGLLCCILVSLNMTSKENRRANSFSWGPIVEVAKLFAGIFVVIMPVIAILKAGNAGAMSGLVLLVKDSLGMPNDMAFFWLTGFLSSFLDNAPTYLVFFELAGGNPEQLMTVFSSTLAAISCGAVFMGANTYIGNAPNFMVYAIARQNKIKMPSFFSYMIWSGVILMPIHLITSFLFFR